MNALDDEQRKLAEQNHMLAFHFANKYKGKFHPLSFCELVSAAQMGLIDAASKYDESLKYKFSTFAYFWMRQYAYEDRRRALRWLQHENTNNPEVDVAASRESIDNEDGFDAIMAILKTTIPAKSYEMVEMRIGGYNLEEIAERFGCTRQNVSLIMRRHLGIKGKNRVPTIMTAGRKHAKKNAAIDS